MSLPHFLLAQAKEVLNETLATPTNATASTATPVNKEGRTCAYIALVVMAVVPILIGSKKSVKSLNTQKEKQKADGSEPEKMTTRDAAMFPVIASVTLLSIYILFKVFSKDNINLLLTAYFFILGVLALTQVLAPIVKCFWPENYLDNFDLKFIRTRSSNKKEINYLIDLQFTTHHVIGLVLSSFVGVWYIFTKHWIANNIFGIAFSINGIEMLHLNSVWTGIILLSGLFFYDIFWVFGTDVMVTVAKSFDAPIKLLFPQDFLVKGVFGTQFAMLGLGDIVIPGIFIALLLRYDVTLNRKSNAYFNSAIFAYTLGLVVTVVVLTVFNHAQPALLYLVPSCILIPTSLALCRGDISSMFAYNDHPEDSNKKEEQEEGEEEQTEEIKKEQ